MKNMTLSAIARAVSGELHIGKPSDENKEATCVVVDSRLIKEGGIFVATKGERVDGHSFICQVMEKGALAAICEVAPENEEYSYILVKDSFDALKKAAKFYRQQLDIKIIGIIGSVGKTSTKEIVASVLSEKYNVLKTEGNFNNEVGVPLTICRIRDEHEVAVVEMGISDFNEMSRLGDIVRPDGVIMTNIGPCHLENLKDLDGVLRAKTEVFDYIKDGGPVILNAGDDKLASVKKREGLNIVFYGEGTDYYADNIENLGLKGTAFDLNVNGSSIRTRVNLPGYHMVTNSLSAAAVADKLGLSITEIAEGIKKATGLTGRSNLIETDKFLIIDDCYNANPKSMRAAIDLMKDALSRKVAILGDMFELGADETYLHGEIGSYAIDNGINLLICVGKLSRYMFDAAFERLDKCGHSAQVLYYEKKEDLITDISSDKSPLEKSDTILIKASHGMGFSELVELIKNQ